MKYLTKSLKMKKIFTRTVLPLSLMVLSFFIGNQSLLAQENECQDFVYYMSDNNGSTSDVYRVNINEGQAEMTLLKSFDYALHIAYNNADDLLYVVRASNGSFRTLDVSVVDGAASAETARHARPSHSRSRPRT